MINTGRFNPSAPNLKSLWNTSIPNGTPKTKTLPPCSTPSNRSLCTTRWKCSLTREHTRSGSKSIQECRRSIRFFVGVEHRYRLGAQRFRAYYKAEKRRQRGGNARKRVWERERERGGTEGKRKREERKDGVIKTSTVFLVALYRTRY